MDKNENIGRILKDRLKKLDRTPSENVWNTIELELNKGKKKRKAIWFFYRISGIAIFALLFLIVFYNSKNKTNIKEKFPITNHQNNSENKFNDINNNQNTVTKKQENNTDIQSELVNKSITNSTKIKKNHYKNNETTNKYQSHSLVINSDIETVRSFKSDSKKNQLITSNIQNKLEKDKNNSFENKILDNSNNINVAKNEKKKVEINTSESKTLRKNTNIQKTKTTKNKFQVSIYATSIFYNSLIKGSTSNSSLTNNTNVTLGYGVNASIPINKKLWLRMGITNFELTYHTSTISYLEFPLDLKYKLKYKKIGIEPIIGTSILLLNNQTTVFNESVNLGILNNLNFFTLTGNISVLADYKIYKNISIFIEPKVKILFNAYSNDSNHKPFTLEVHTGLSYQF